MLAQVRVAHEWSGDTTQDRVIRQEGLRNWELSVYASPPAYATHTLFKDSPEALRGVLAGRVAFYYSPSNWPNLFSFRRTDPQSRLAAHGARVCFRMCNIHEDGRPKSDYEVWIDLGGVNGVNMRNMKNAEFASKRFGSYG